MVDADLFMLQLCATNLPTGQYINNILDRCSCRKNVKFYTVWFPAI
jgi:hypothetical protein